MKKLLWVGDAGVPSGFARATHEILDTLRFAYDVTVLGINYRGDPHGYPYPIWSAAAEGDVLGAYRLVWMCDFVKPDVIVLQNDGWNIQQYIRRVQAKKPSGEYMFPEHAAVPIIAIVAVDGKNFQGGWLDGVDHAVFWTQFALNEARAGGYTGPASVISLGVHLETYKLQDKQAARRRRMPVEMAEAFIVGNVNRNQSRKRWDLTVKYFAEWIKAKHVEDAWLYMQPAPTGDTSTDVQQLARYYGVEHRIALAHSDKFYGVSEQEMAELYSCLDVCVSTTQGEGFGLPALEAMACGVPCILPDWSAYGEWAKAGAWLVPCTSTAVGQPYVNVIGGVPDERKFVEALHALYANAEARKNNAQAALECAQQSCFRWENVGQAYLEMLDALLYPAVPVREDAPHAPTEAEWLDLGRPEEAHAKG